MDPFPYFPDDVREALLGLMLRQAEPRAGKIDHDIDGRLVGNWFEQGTNGYGGANPQAYWEGHLAFVPDALDPTQWRFSTGNYEGNAAQFGIIGNLPAPSEVSVDTGLVTYELTNYEYLVGPGRERRWMAPGETIASVNTDRVLGVALVQMTGPRNLRSDVFPGKTAEEVSGFTAAARTFER